MEYSLKDNKIKESTPVIGKEDLPILARSLISVEKRGLSIAYRVNYLHKRAEDCCPDLGKVNTCCLCDRLADRFGGKVMEGSNNTGYWAFESRQLALNYHLLSIILTLGGKSTFDKLLKKCKSRVTVSQNHQTLDQQRKIRCRGSQSLGLNQKLLKETKGAQEAQPSNAYQVIALEDDYQANKGKLKNTPRNSPSVPYMYVLLGNDGMAEDQFLFAVPDTKSLQLLLETGRGPKRTQQRKFQDKILFVRPEELAKRWQTS